MRRSSWPLFVLVCVVASAAAAPVEVPIADLERRLAAAPAQEQAGLLNEIANRVVRRDGARALDLAGRALALARRFRDAAGEAHAEKNLGLALMVLERSPEGLPHMQRARELFRALGDRAEEARTTGYSGMLLAAMGKLRPAVEAGQEALEQFRALGDLKGMAAATNNLGVRFTSLGDYEQALRFNLQSLELEQRLGRKIGIANNLNSIGNIYSELGDHLRARDYYQRALALFEELGERPGAAKALNNLGNTYEKADRDEEALRYFTRSAEMARAVGLRGAEADATNNTGIVYKKKGRYDDALREYLRVVELRNAVGEVALLTSAYHNIAEVHLLRGRYAEALAYLDKDLAIANQTKSNETLASAYLLRSQVNHARGDDRAAYEDQVRYADARDAMLDEQRTKAIAELQERFDADARKRQIELLSKDNELLKKDGEIRRLALARTRLAAGLLVAVATLSAGGALLLLRRFRYLFSFWKRRSYIGHYRLVRTIASGGMGTVYKAADVSQGDRPCALKVIREEFSDDPVLRKRFIHEAALVDQLDHPCVVRVLERGEHDHRLFIAMELLEGPSLADVIARETPVSVAACLEITLQLADALSKIHAKGICHRDLKPENVMFVAADGRENAVKLLDFGLATAQSLSKLTQAGTIMGTISYLPPEQLTEQTFTAASDVYSLGVIVYEMLTRSKPFPGDTPADVIRQILERQPVPPSELRPDVPERMGELVLAMMAKEPGRRPDEAAIRARVEDLLALERVPA